uniref:K Homology domain-containing protein n=1 Tax=Ascaris lumbricoides TaxID=6252 RepID=A0A9J2Q3R8_ASCLU
MLPSSTERAVTISGSADAIVLCMQHICHILLEAPPKGTTLPYRPKPTFNPLLLASSAAAAAAQQQAAAAAALLQPYPATLITPTDAPPKGTTLPYRPKPTFNPLLLASSAAAAAAQQQAAAAAALLQPYPATLITPTDLARVHSQYAATQFLPAVPALNPQTVFGGNLIGMSASTDRADYGKDTSVRWMNPTDDKSAELMQNLIAAPPYMFGNRYEVSDPYGRTYPPCIELNILLGRTMPMTTTTKQTSPSPGQNAASLLLQQNPRRYTPY